MSTTIEAQGHTVDEAIQIALNQLGVSRDKVEIDILHHPRRGVLGIGARRAKVRATIRETVMADGEEFDMSGGASLDDKPRRRRRRGGRSRGGDEAGPPRSAAGSQRPSAEGQDAAGRGDGRGQGRRDGEGGRGRGGDARSRDDRRGGGRGKGGERTAAAEGQAGRGGQSERGSGQSERGSGQSERGSGRGGRGGDQRRAPGGQRDQGRGRGGRQGGQAAEAPGGDRTGDTGNARERNGSRGRGPRDQQPDRHPEGRSAADVSPARAPQTPAGSGRASETILPRRPAVEETPLDAAALEEIRARAEALVRELLEKMGFPAEVSSSIDEAAGEAVVSVRSESEGLLIGRRGQTLDSLEHIVNRMALRADAYAEGRVLLDIGDYRKRRRESLEELAGRLRERAVTERRAVQVSPMSPRDRRFFAQAFADDEAVELRSLGAGFYRRIVVAPAGGAGGTDRPDAEAARDVSPEPPDAEEAGSEAQVDTASAGADAET